MKMYVYGMRQRGFSHGCQPMNGFIERRNSPCNTWYDLIIYSRRLSKQEMLDYELDYIGKEDS